MINSKQTYDKYNDIRESIKTEAFQFVAEVNNKKQSIIDSLNGFEEYDWEAIKIRHNVKSDYIKKFREKNKDLISEYKKLGAEHRDNKEAFQELFRKAKEFNRDLDEWSLKDFIMWKLEQKESKEISKNSLEFEENNFKIDSTWWKTWRRNIYGLGSLKVKTNSTGDVFEYLEWPTKGEQIFMDYDFFLREVCKAKNCSPQKAEEKYLMTIDELKKIMLDKPDNSEEYSNYFWENFLWRCSGFYSHDADTILGIDKSFCFWLAGGKIACFQKDKLILIDDKDTFKGGFSGCLIKTNPQD
jgi:hypothetical protein